MNKQAYLKSLTPVLNKQAIDWNHPVTHMVAGAVGAGALGALAGGAVKGGKGALAGGVTGALLGALGGSGLNAVRAYCQDSSGIAGPCSAYELTNSYGPRIGKLLRRLGYKTDKWSLYNV